MADLPRGTVTFLFTDIEGSTALWERDRTAMRAAVNQHLALLREVIADHDGVAFKTVGDAVQAAFATRTSSARSGGGSAARAADGDLARSDRAAPTCAWRSTRGWPSQATAIISPPVSTVSPACWPRGMGSKCC